MVMSRLRWTHTTGSIAYGGLAVAGGAVCVGSFDGKVYAMDAATGHLRWTYATGPWDSELTVAGGIVYVGDDSKVCALGAATGHRR